MADTDNDGIGDTKTYDGGRQTGGQGNSSQYFGAYTSWSADGSWTNGTSNRIYRNIICNAGELAKANDSTYTLDDPIYGKTGLGCFYYVIDPVENADIVNAYFNSATGDCGSYAANAADLATALNLMHTAVAGKTVSVTNWPTTGSEGYWNLPITKNITDSKGLVYIHLVDRWGNCYDNIVRLNNYDDATPTLTKGSGTADITVTETAGSGIADISLYEYSYTESIAYIKNQTRFDVVVSTSNPASNDYYSSSGNVYTFTTCELHNVTGQVHAACRGQCGQRHGNDDLR